MPARRHPGAARRQRPDPRQHDARSRRSVQRHPIAGLAADARHRLRLLHRIRAAWVRTLSRCRRFPSRSSPTAFRVAGTGIAAHRFGAAAAEGLLPRVLGLARVRGRVRADARRATRASSGSRQRPTTALADSCGSLRFRCSTDRIVLFVMFAQCDRLGGQPEPSGTRSARTAVRPLPECSSELARRIAATARSRRSWRCSAPTTT